jgi:hypothetical protein
VFVLAVDRAVKIWLGDDESVADGLDHLRWNYRSIGDLKVMRCSLRGVFYSIQSIHLHFKALSDSSSGHFIAFCISHCQFSLPSIAIYCFLFLLFSPVTTGDFVC